MWMAPSESEQFFDAVFTYPASLWYCIIIFKAEYLDIRAFVFPSDLT